MLLQNYKDSRHKVECLLSVDEAEALIHNSKKLSIDALRLIKTMVRATSTEDEVNDYVSVLLTRRYLATTASGMAETHKLPIHTAPRHTPFIIETGDHHPDEGMKCRKMASEILDFLIPDMPTKTQSSDDARQ